MTRTDYTKMPQYQYFSQCVGQTYQVTHPASGKSGDFKAIDVTDSEIHFSRLVFEDPDHIFREEGLFVYHPFLEGLGRHVDQVDCEDSPALPQQEDSTDG